MRSGDPTGQVRHRVHQRRIGGRWRRTDTGPTARTRRIVHARSGDRCEWPGCHRRRAHLHHRLNRKAGGRFGAARARLNGAAWVVDCCVAHHHLVTSPTGVTRRRVMTMGWVLGEADDARVVPILTRHDPDPVLLDDAGSWTPLRAAA